MAKFLHFEECPKCVAGGRDKAKDNLGRYSDDSGHCFSCGFHVFPKHIVRKVEENVDESKTVLPVDFSREVPAAGWKWLLQYGLSYSYWKPYIGYSETHDRLVFTFGQPPRFSIGRSLSDEPSKRKWRMWGDGHGYVEILGNKTGGSSCVLVEDLISAHKVAQVSPCICLFGTNIHDVAVQELVRFNGPTTLWLDRDQYTLLPKKIGRLQTFLRHPVRYVSTDKDPKEYSSEEIKEHLK